MNGWTVSRSHGERSMWTVERGVLLSGILIAVLLLGLFHSVVSGAVHRSTLRQLQGVPSVDAVVRVAAVPD
jgi:hypothetical protein